MTYPERTTSDFSPRPLPRDTIFSATGQAVFFNNEIDRTLYLGLAYTRIFKVLMELFIGAGDATESGSAARHYTSGILNEIPYPQFNSMASEKIAKWTNNAIEIRRDQFSRQETSANFKGLILGAENALSLKEFANHSMAAQQEETLKLLYYGWQIDKEVSSAFGIGKEASEFLIQETCYHPYDYPDNLSEMINYGAYYKCEIAELITTLCERFEYKRAFTKKAYWAERRIELISHLMQVHPQRLLEGQEQVKEQIISDLAKDILGYMLGLAFGRWDIRFTTGEHQPPELPDPFDPLPVCPPGMLQGPDGLPAKAEDVPSDYQVHIDWDGILVDDPGHQDDIVHRVREVLEVIWKERAEAIEQEACEILGVRELRDYFRKPGNGGFWMDHVKRYSKSRRKAPIYWYLRSAKGNYGLWLYYHRLDKDLLFKALLNYVEPKIRLEEDRLKTLRGRKEAAGSSGREAKQLERDLDRQDQLVSELHDFKDKLRRAADLHLTPDLNDGVALNIAPLWQLVPWKEAQKYWDELIEGKYDWSIIGKQLREKGLVR